MTSFRSLASLLGATIAEVSGIAYWFHFLQQSHYVFAYASLIAGEAVEYALLAALIITAKDAYPRRSGQVGVVLTQTGLVIFSESFLWFVWIILIARIGLVEATAILLVLMHVKHTAAVSFFHGRSLREDVWKFEGLAATLLEVGGALVFYRLASSGSLTHGVVVLALCIGLEHSLQFRAAGVVGDPRPIALHS